MTRLSMRRALCTAAALPLIVGLAACGGSSDGENEEEGTASGVSCDAFPRGTRRARSKPCPGFP